MAKFLSGRKTNLKLGITDHTVNDTVLQTIGKVGIGITNAGHFSLYVNGPTNITGDTLVGGGLTVTDNLDVGGVVIGGGGGGDTTIGDDIQTRNFRATGISTFEGLVDINGGADISGGIGLNVVGHTELDEVNVSGVSTYGGAIDANAGILASTLKVEDLTPGRVVLAGAGGELEDDSNLTYDGYTLNTGNLIGVGATFSGNVSIAGTLTYEDVTNVDAVGLVTAREGIRIPYDNKMLQIGLSDDLQLYHDSQNSYIKDNGTGSLRILGGNTTFMNAAENKTSAVFNVATSVDLYNNNVLRLQTTGYGVTVYDTLQAPQLNITGVSTFAGNIDANGDLDVDGHTELDNVNISGILTAAQFTGGGGGTIIGEDITTRNLNVTGLSTFAGLAIFNDGVNVSGLTTLGGHVHVTNGNIKFFNSRKAIFGDSDELEIQYTGSASQINDTSGELYINTDNIHLRDKTTGATFLQASVGAGVTSFFNGLKKFETTSSGVTVTGALTATGEINAGRMTLSDDGSASPILLIKTDDANPWGFQVRNDTYGTGSEGFKVFQSNSGVNYIQTRGTSARGRLIMQQHNGTTTNNMIEFTEAGAVDIDYQGSSKLTTTNEGVKVTGVTSTTDLYVTGISTFGGLVSAGGTTGTDGQYLRSTGVGVTWSSFPAMRTSQSFTATEGQTTFNFTYNVNLLDVFLNGVKLTPSEYTASNGSTVVLNSGCFAGDTIDLYSYNVASTGSSGGPGPAGPAGPSGSKGQKGEAGSGPGGGSKGQKGEVGSKGQKGQDGVAASKGQKGEVGAGGPGGPAGSKGQKGQTGADNSTKGQKGEEGSGGSGTGGLFEQTSVGINTLSKVGIGTTNPKFDLDIGSYVANNVSTASTIRIIGENNSTAIRIGPGGTSSDITLIRVDSTDGTTDGSGNTDLGHSIKYMGSGSGVDNRLAFWVDNTSQTPYEAFAIFNNGVVGINRDVGFENAPTNQLDVTGTTETTHLSVTGVATATSYYGDGSNLTGITGIGATGAGTYTTNTQVAEQIDSLSLSIKAAEYVLHFENASGIQAQKLMVMHDGTTAYSNESAIMFSANLLVSVGATISGGNLLVEATPEFTNSGLSTYRFTRYELM